jgi:hypothetical protein
MAMTREDLVLTLAQAAEIEHAVCCMYLFAGFALKRSPDEGIGWAEVEQNREWAATLFTIAREEMGHLGVVCNLQGAIGGVPQLWRPPFPHSVPIGPGAAPLELKSLTPQSLDRLIQFETAERPEGTATGDGSCGRIPTIGDLYREIRSGFETMDQATLFVGSRQAQLRIDFPSAVNLGPIHDRAEAMLALDRLVTESGGGSDSHLARLTAMKQELDAALAADPGFEPSRRVVSNPSSGRGRRPEGQTAISDPDTRVAMDMFSRAYLAMLLVLHRISSPSGETEEELDSLRSIAYFPLMTMVIRPLGEMLTCLPAGVDMPGATAGPGFELPEQVMLPSDKRAAWLRLSELLEQLTSVGGHLVHRGVLGDRGEFLHQNLQRIESDFRRAMRF